MKLTEEELLEEKEIRERMLSEKNAEVLGKVKEIVWLGEDKLLTIQQVADYYEVAKTNIDTLIENHKEEFSEDGLKTLEGDELRQFKGHALKMHDLYEEHKYAHKLRVVPRRAVLRVGMLLRDSEVAKTVRSYLLNIENVVDIETKEWALKREASKMIRKQFTKDIAKSGEDKRMKGWGYSNYTNLIYRVLFDKTANQMKEDRNAPDNKLRDYLTKDELEAVKRLERIITSQLSVGKNYQQIKVMLYNDLDPEMIEIHPKGGNY